VLAAGCVGARRRGWVGSVRWLPRPNAFDVAYGVIGLFIVSYIWASQGDTVAFVTGILMVLRYFAGGVKYRPERWEAVASPFSPVCEARGHRVQAQFDRQYVIVYRHVEHAEATLEVSKTAPDVRKQVVAWIEGIHRLEGDPG